MISIETILRFLKLPLDLLVVVIKYYLGATKYRKYANRLKICLKLTIYRFGLSIPIQDAHVLKFMENSTLFKVLKFQYPKLTSTIPGYGEQFGNHGIWFAKDNFREKDDPIIIYSHGGGYFLETQLEQLKSLVAIYKHLDPTKKYSILFLDYDLVSMGRKFPRQLNQLDLVYSDLVEQGNTNIILMGDSAGGHLSISYVQYIYSHKPFLPYPKQLVLISPWCKLNIDSKSERRPGRSYNDNRLRDLISIDIFKPELFELFLNPKNIEFHPYFNWSHEPETNWSKIPFFKDPKNKVFVIYGEDESFRDHIIEWTNEVFGNHLSYERTNNKYSEICTKTIESKDKPKLVTYMEPWGVHDGIFFTEYDAIGNIENAKTDKYFGISKVIKFLNE